MADVTFHFKDEGLQENLNCFVAAEPIPTAVGNELGGPKYTPAQWWKAWVILKTKQAIQKGKNKLEATKIDEDVIE